MELSSRKQNTRVEFSVVIPAFNEEKRLPATLAAVNAARSGISAEVIVVDNESSDRTAQIASLSGAKVVSESEHNIGRVRNTGARAARGDVLIFLDADTIVSASRKIAEKMRADEKCLGGAVAVDYGELRRKWMRFYLMGWRFWGGFFEMKQGAAQFCRKAVFEELNGYDEEIFVGEDIQFYRRLAKFARRSPDGYLFFIQDPKVLTSPRRFDQMRLAKIFPLTHPLYIRLRWKKNPPGRTGTKKRFADFFAFDNSGSSRSESREFFSPPRAPNGRRHKNRPS